MAGRAVRGLISIAALSTAWTAIGAGPPSVLLWADAAAVSGTGAGIVFEDSFQLGARISLEKQSTVGDPYAKVGDVVEYELVAVNYGVVELREVVITDPELSEIECTPAQPVDLAPDGQLVCTGNRAMLQADIDKGESTNFADVVGLDPDDEPVIDTAQVTVSGPEADPQIEVSKLRTDNAEPVELGTVLAFEISALNTGNVTLNELTVTDSQVSVSQSGDCDWDGSQGELVPGDQVVCSIAYTVTQDDVDAGEVVNTGTVTAEDPDLVDISDADTVTVDIGQHPDLSVVKTLTDSTDDPVVEGSVLTFGIDAENTGDVTLDNVAVSDSLGLVDPAGDCQWDGTQAQLAPGESVLCAFDYSVTQDDVDAGEVVNTGTVTAEDPDLADISDVDTVTVDIGQHPDLNVVKTLTDSTDDPVVEGSVLTFGIDAENSGDVTLDNVVVSDSLGTIDPAGDCQWDGSQGELVPGDQVVCSIAYTVTQDDVDAGEVVNTGTVTAEDPDLVDISDADTVTVDIGQHPDLSVVKTLTDSTDDPVVEGSVLTFGIDAENTGNVTLNELTVTDSQVSVSQSGDCDWDGSQGELVPGDQVVCSIAYTVTQDDVDAGEVVNTGFVSGQDPDLVDISDADTVTVDIGQHPDLSVVKTLTDSTNDPIVEGSVLTFGIDAENTGDVTLDNVVVSDSLGTIDPAGDCQWDGTQAQLAPGESVLCSFDYTVTSGDVDASEVVNTGTVTTDDPDSTEISSIDTVTTPIEDSDPSTPIEEALEPLLQVDNLRTVMYQDPDTKEWLSYDPRPEFEDSNTLHEIIDDEAYWVEVNFDQTVVLNGIERELTCTNPGTPEEDCWNLIVW